MWKQVRFGESQKLYGILEEPVNPPANQSLVLTLSGLGQAMSEKNYLFSNLRKSMAVYNQRFVQFDYFGHGDSYGELGDCSVSSMIEDALLVLQTVTERIRPKCIYLVGNALGALIAKKVSLIWEREQGVKCIPILISPPLALPKARNVIDVSVYKRLKENGKLDSQVLVPGYDYYTLSDFDPEQYKYFTSLGAHMLYLHGQCISERMLTELDQISPITLLNEGSQECFIIVGEKDTESLELVQKIARKTVYQLNDVSFYYQHPQAMDELIDIIQDIIIHHKV